MEYETINGVKLDMTPQSLLMPVRSAQPPSRAPKGAAGAESGSNQAEIMGKGGGQPGVDHAKEALASGRESKSGTATGEGGFRKQSSGGMGKKKSDLKHDHGKSRAQMRAHNQALGRMGSHASAGAGAADEARQLAEQEKYEAFMKATIEICLEETETETILHVPGDAIPNDYKDFEAIKARNAAYGRLVEGKKGSDNYAGRRAQTLNPGRKDKEAAADPPAQRDAEAMASAFDIFDAMQREEEADDPDEEHAAAAQGGLPGGAGDGHLQLTAVLFAINAPILVVGDSEGCIDVFRVHNVDTHPQARFENQVEELQRAIYPDGLPSDKIRRNS